MRSTLTESSNPQNVPADLPQGLSTSHVPINLSDEAGDHLSEQQDHFPCQQCGADLDYAPTDDALVCAYCGFRNPIPEDNRPIYEYDFAQSLRALRQQQSHDQMDASQQVQIIHCPSCGARFELHDNEHSGRCPFCDSNVVTDVQTVRHIQPESLLPFAINAATAKASFKQWLASRWFAPNALKKKARHDESLAGIYLPYWTYDSQTDTDYQGERGTVYYERQYYTTVVDGRTVRQVRNVPRIRWTPVSGHIHLFFDDVLIGATHTLPRKILDRLEPWDLQNLKPYKSQYLSGFRSEIYQVELDQGFQQAEAVMKDQIRRAIYQDIGGDQQRIHRSQTQHSDTRFKHLLLPIWSSAFKYQGKTYRFVVNGRNGKVAGERPYSALKIAAAVIMGIALVSGAVYYAQKYRLFEQLQQPTYQRPLNPNYPLPYEPSYQPYRR